MLKKVRLKKGTPLTLNYKTENEIVALLLKKGDKISKIMWNGFYFVIPTEWIIGTIKSDEKREE